MATNTIANNFVYLAYAGMITSTWVAFYSIYKVLLFIYCIGLNAVLLKLFGVWLIEVLTSTFVFEI